MDEPAPMPSRCRVRAWRPPGIDGVSEVFHAQIVDYGYPSHCHDTWTVLIVDQGAIRYDLDKRSCGAVGQTVAILPPGVTHNGRPAPGAAGFAKRVLYLEPSFLPPALIGAAVDNTNIEDPRLRSDLAAFHHQLAVGADPFHAESSLALIADRIRHHLEHQLEHQPEPAGVSENQVAAKLRRLLDHSIGGPLTLATAAEQLGRSKAHLVRTFTAAYGLAPHEYLIGKRIERARWLLLEGMGPADVAATVGFYDQAHLTRHFKKHTSVPPATYAASNLGLIH